MNTILAYLEAMLSIIYDEIQRLIICGQRLYNKIFEISFEDLSFTWSIDKALNKKQEIICKIQRVKYKI